MDLAPGQSLYKALKMLNIYSCTNAKSSRAKLSLLPVNLPNVRPLVKPLVISIKRETGPLWLETGVAAHVQHKKSKCYRNQLRKISFFLNLKIQKKLISQMYRISSNLMHIYSKSDLVYSPK